MADDNETAGHDPAITNYFLDVLTSGLGAAVLLFLIFAVLPHFGESGAMKSQGPREEQAAIGGAGQSAEAELDKLPGRAYVLLRVKVQSLGGGTFNRLAGNWTGIKLKPGEIETPVESYPNAPGQMSWCARFRNGLQGSRKVEFHLSDLAYMKKKFEVCVSASSGGTQSKTIVFEPTPTSDKLVRRITLPLGVEKQPTDLPLPGAGSLMIVRFDFNNKGDWIVFP